MIAIVRVGIELCFFREEFVLGSPESRARRRFHCESGHFRFLNYVCMK